MSMLPDGVRFEQYVLRIPRAASVLVLDDDERVLMLWRHRFILDRWVWELPGGYLDPDEEPAACAAREVEEETGWRPRNMELILTFQPAVGTINQENLVFFPRGADPTGLPPDINETAKIASACRGIRSHSQGRDRGCWLRNGSPGRPARQG